MSGNRNVSKKHWICKECDFRNNKALSPAKCIFCSNKWKCQHCNFFNSIKNCHCALCESKWDSLSSSNTDSDYFDNDNDDESDELLPKYRIQVPHILIPSDPENSKHKKLEIKKNKIAINEVKGYQYQIKLLDVVNSSY
eukprot:UN00378